MLHLLPLPFPLGSGRAAIILSQSRPSKAVLGFGLGGGVGAWVLHPWVDSAEFGRKYVPLTLGTIAGLSETRNVPENTKKGVVIGESLLESSNSTLGWGEGNPPGLPWFCPGPCVHGGRWEGGHTQSHHLYASQWPLVASIK